MKVDIIYENSKTSLMDALFYLYPHKKEIIKNIIDKIKINNSIILNDNKITFENENSPIVDERRLFLSENEFIYYITLLKRCKDAVIVTIDNCHSYNELTKFNHQLKYRLILHENTSGLYNKDFVNAIIVNNEMHIVTIDVCDLLFKNIRRTDTKNFIRQIKLKQLL
jgi:hypothetical protein